MDAQRGLVLWVAGFAGLALILSAYKGKSVLSTVTSRTGEVAGTPGPTNSADSGAGQGRRDPSSPYAGIVNQDGTWVSLDEYGAIGDPIPAVYQRFPGSYVGRTERIA